MKLTLRHWEQDMDLRKICRGRMFWWAAKRRLRNGDAILFTNAAMDRCRIVAMFGGIPWMISPPIADREHAVSMLFDLAMDWVCGLRGSTRLEVAA